MLAGYVLEGVDGSLAEVHTGNGDPELASVEHERHGHRADAGGSGLRERDVRGESSPGGHDLVDRLAERMRLVDARDRRGRGVPVPDHAVAVEQDDAVGDVGECLGRVGALLGLAVEAGVVDGDRRSVRELQRELEIGLRVGRVRLRGDQRERTKRASARRERNTDCRAQAEFVDDLPQLVVVADRLFQDLVWNHGEELSLTRAEHLRHAVRLVRLRRIAVLQCVRPAHLLGVLVGDCEPDDLAVFAGHVDRAPVGEPRHGELRELPEREVVVE